MSVMSNQSISINGVKEARTNSGEGLSPDRCSTEQQGGSGHHRTTAKGGRRRKWSQEGNRIAMECYYSSNPNVLEYQERMHMIWEEKECLMQKNNDCWIRSGRLLQKSGPQIYN